MIIKYKLNTDKPFSHGRDLTIDQEGFHYANVADDVDPSLFEEGAVVAAEDYPAVIALFVESTNLQFDLDNEIVTQEEYDTQLTEAGLI